MRRAILKLLDRKAQRLGLQNHHMVLIDYIIQTYTDFEHGTLLDLGGGSGHLANYTNKGWVCINIDRDPCYKKINNDKGILYHAIDLGGEWPVQKSSVNVIVASQIIEHLWDPADFLKKCYEKLVPNGIIILLTPNIKKVGWNFYNNSEHVTPFTFDKISMLRRPWFDCLYLDSYNHNLYMLKYLVVDDPRPASRFGGNILAVLRKNVM